MQQEQDRPRRSRQTEDIVELLIPGGRSARDREAVLGERAVHVHPRGSPSHRAAPGGPGRRQHGAASELEAGLVPSGTGSGGRRHHPGRRRPLQVVLAALRRRLARLRVGQAGPLGPVRHPRRRDEGPVRPGLDLRGSSSLRRQDGAVADQDAVDRRPRRDELEHGPLGRWLRVLVPAQGPTAAAGHLHQGDRRDYKLLTPKARKAYDLAKAAHEQAQKIAQGGADPAQLSLPMGEDR